MLAKSKSLSSPAGTLIIAPPPYSISTKFAHHTGSFAPVNGWITKRPKSTPSLSICERSLGLRFMIFSSVLFCSGSNKSASITAFTTSCSGASAVNEAPKIVSGRVVKTLKPFKPVLAALVSSKLKNSCAP